MHSVTTHWATSTRSVFPRRSQAGRIGRVEVVEAAIARTEAVNPALNGLAHKAFDRARAQSAAPARGGLFSGVPTFVKDNVDVAGLPTMRGTDAWPPRPAEVDSDFARMYLATGMTPLGKTQMSEYGFSASAEHPRLGPVRNPWNTDHTAGASSSGSGCVRRRRRCADRTRQRRWRIDSNSRVVQRTCRSEAVPRSATAGQRSQSDADPHRRQRDGQPVGARYRGVLPEAERIWPATKLPPIGHVKHAGTQRLRIAVITHSLLRESSPEVRELTLKSAGTARRTGPPRRPSRKAASANKFRVGLRAVLGSAGDGSDSAEQAHLRRIRRDPAGQPVSGPGSARAPQSASHPACATAAFPHAAAYGPPGPHLRRGDDANLGRRDPADRLSRPDGRLRADHRPPARIGSRSRRCRTSRGSRPSRCRWRCPPTGCRWG